MAGKRSGNITRSPRFLPIGIDVRGKKIVVVGGGKVAAQKLARIKIFRPNITVIAPSVLPQVRRLANKVNIGKYDPGQLKGALLVYACTDDKSVNRAVCRDAQELGILYNAADDASSCAFISKAYFMKRGLVVSVDSQGNAPLKTRKAKEYLRKAINGFDGSRDKPQ